MNTKIDIFLNNEENITKLTDEIINIFVNTANKDNIDYEFDLAQGTGKVKTRQPNTYFAFDTLPGTLIDSFKKALFDEDLADIKQDSEEEKELMDKVNGFLGKVSKQMISIHKHKLQETIRRVVLPQSTKEDIPLNEILVTSIDVVDYSSIPESTKYLLKIHKYENADVPTGEIIKFVHNKQEETKQTIEEIYEEEKDDNPLFKNISNIVKGKKYIFDVNIVFFIDYSLAYLPPSPVNN